MPALGKARKRTKEAVCLNNQKQLYLGAALYSDDSSDIVPLGAVKDSWDARANGRIAAFGLLGMEDSPDAFHCPLLNTLSTANQGHNMDIQHPHGSGMSWFHDSSVNRVIAGYNIRSLQWYKLNGGTEGELQSGDLRLDAVLRFNDDPNTILFHDPFDERVCIRWNHIDNYNVVKLDGSGRKIFDKGMVVDNMVPGSFDGHGNVGLEQTTYEYLENK